MPSHIFKSVGTWKTNRRDLLFASVDLGCVYCSNAVLISGCQKCVGYADYCSM